MRDGDDGSQCASGQNPRASDTSPSPAPLSPRAWPRSQHRRRPRPQNAAAAARAAWRHGRAAMPRGNGARGQGQNGGRPSCFPGPSPPATVCVYSGYVQYREAGRPLRVSSQCVWPHVRSGGGSQLEIETIYCLSIREVESIVSHVFCESCNAQGRKEVIATLTRSRVRRVPRPDMRVILARESKYR